MGRAAAADVDSCGASRFKSGSTVVVRGEEGGSWDERRRRLMREGCGAERALVARGGEGGAGAAIGPGGGG